MNIERIDTWWESIPLTRPYRIAHHATETVDLGFVQVHGDEGSTGFGCAAPVEEITGESLAACRSALERMRGLRGNSIRVNESRDTEFQATPAARAALDMALVDVISRRSRANFLGFMRYQLPEALATSVTIGIRPLDETLAEADEYLGRGFTILKVKIGEDCEHDIERLTRLRERIGPRIGLRADANLGYCPREVERFFERTAELEIQFLEQPCPRALDDELKLLPEAIRRRLAADESLFDLADARRLALDPRPFGIWNIKLMKCGGFEPALRISWAARDEVELMWGCMDESVVSIAAALRMAYRFPQTRYLDLDGSFDLERDPFRGGFELRDGRMHVLDAPGLGVERNA